MRKRRALVAMLAVTLSAMGAAAEAGAKKGKKKGKPAVTRFAERPARLQRLGHGGGGLRQGHPRLRRRLRCRTELQPFTSGLRSHAATSFPTGPKGWSATASAFSNPSAAGSLTAYARCERNSLGQLTSRIESSTTLNPGDRRHDLAELLSRHPRDRRRLRRRPRPTATRSSATTTSGSAGSSSCSRGGPVPPSGRSRASTEPTPLRVLL